MTSIAEANTTVGNMSISPSRDRSPVQETVYFSPACSTLAQTLLSELSIDERRLQVAVDYSGREHVPLADAVIDLGFVPESDTYRMLAKATRMELVDLSAARPSALALRLVPERVARRHRLLPLHEDNQFLTYVIGRPFHHDAERDVSFASGRRPYAVLAPRSDIRAALERHYDNLGDLDLLVSRVRSNAHVEILDAGDAVAAGSAPVRDLCNHIVARAVDAGASDIHLEATRSGLAARFRIDGVLSPAPEPPRQVPSSCGRAL